MNARIYKYKLQPIFNQPQTIGVPRPATVLHLGAQGSDIVAWLEVDPNRKYAQVHFWLAWTGYERPGYEYHYLGTIQHANDEVYHVYYRVESEP
jgi:hypothetical protein